MAQLTTDDTAPADSFAVDHRAALAAFQEGGESCFVWGYDRSTETMFFLDDDQAPAQKDYVVEHVVCPVPGCKSPLTTVHSTVKRDHLRHLARSGGHGLESLFHSQGCALIQSWLARKYPHCSVTREEYISPQEERRADVLITAPTGERIAFEVQYSPLTHDVWTRRHESYRARGVQDVWLFGHTPKQLKLDGHGLLTSKPALAAVAASGAPLLFINPTTEQLALAVEHRARFSATVGDFLAYREVAVLGTGAGSELELFDLDAFRLGAPALTSDRIDELTKNARKLEAYNADQQERYARGVEQARHRQAVVDAAKAASRERAKPRRERLAEQIRVALDARAAWDRNHPAMAPLIEYLAQSSDSRFDHVGGMPLQWQCVAFFQHIATRQGHVFGVRDVADTLYRHRIRLGPGTYRTIRGWLDALVDLEFLFTDDGADGFPVFEPTYRGIWW